MNTEIVIGLVTSQVDITQSFKFQAEIIGTGEVVNVIYTCPYHFRGRGGVISVPGEGSKVLILKTNTATLPASPITGYFYISTIVESFNTLPGIQDPSILFTPITKENYYSDKDIPHRLTFTNAQDAGLVIKDARIAETEISPGYIVSETKLQSEAGKIISLQDSPLDNKINMRNEHGDGIMITSDAIDSCVYDGEFHGELASRSIYTSCDGHNIMRSYTGNIAIQIMEGKEIDIENNSVGFYADNSSEGIQNGSNRRCGNVNIKSVEHDINIRAGLDDSSDSSIFITTPKCRIQINSDGSIDIKSQGNININAGDSLNLQATNDIKLKCTNLTINTDSNTAINAGGTFLAKSGSINSLEGSQIHFNSPGIVPTPASIQTLEEPITNAYGE